MARTKQIARKSTPSIVPIIPCVTHNLGNVTLVNDSSHCVSCTLKRKIATETGEIQSKHAEYFSLRAGTTKVVSLGYVARQGDAPDTVVGWTVAFSNYGVLFRSDTTPPPQQNARRQWEALVEANETCHLIDDPQNPPLTDEQIGSLTEEEFAIVETTLLRVLQQAAPYVGMYENLCQQLPQNIAQRRHPEILRRAFESNRRRNQGYRLPHWPNRFAAVRPTLDASFGQADLDEHLVAGTGRACVNVYWRALDRQPGGNADNHTVCFTFDCASRTVSTRTASNWDGTLERSEHRPANLSSAIQNDTGSFPEFLAALRNLGLGDSECTILDSTTEDCEDYDTTWSSHEIVVSLPRVWTPSTHHQYSKGFRSLARQFLFISIHHCLPSGVVHRILQFAAPLNCVPVARLHQRCVFGPQYRTYRVNEDERPPPQIPPTLVQASVLQAAKDLVGMGRVNTWTDARDGEPPCRAKQDRPEEAVRDRPLDGFYLCGFLHPLYFDFPARNVAEDPTTATSKEWVSHV